MSDLPKISVVLPIRNEERFIARTIEYLQSQDYPADKLEILVVDGESTDKTAEIVRQIAERDQRVRLLNNPGRLSSAARNVGAKAATGQIVTYIDGHTYIDNNQLLRNVAVLMNKEGLSVLSRPQFLETPENDFFQRSVALARRSAIGHGLDSTIYSDKDMRVDPTSSGASYRREVFGQAGYFDERFDACEDVEFNYRVGQHGFQSFTSLKLAVYYYPRESLKGLFHQMKRYGIGRFRLARKHPGSLSLGTLIPFLFTVAPPVLIGLSFLHNYFLGLLILAMAGYTGIIAAAASVIALRQGLSYWPILLPIFAAIHFGLGWGFLLEMIRTLAGRGPELERWKPPPDHAAPAGKDV